MQKPLLSIFSFSLILISASAQYTYQWTAQFGGSNTDYAYAVAVDNDGGVISGGEFRYTIDFDSGFEGKVTLTTDDGLNNVYISKLNSDFSYAAIIPLW